jgi:antitoxin (DNA-binding transcriptional repressor) of toxin-antitoxin stability system
MKMSPRTISDIEAESSLPELLKEVRRGIKFTITRGGHAIVCLTPVAAPARRGRRKPGKKIRVICRRYTITGVCAMAMRTADTKPLLYDGP